jgi:hypothetical protein
MCCLFTFKILNASDNVSELLKSEEGYMYLLISNFLLFPEWASINKVLVLITPLHSPLSITGILVYLYLFIKPNIYCLVALEETHTTSFKGIMISFVLVSSN